MKIAVVGRGLIGASAARHLAKSGLDVTLIGPGEPEDRASHDGVFGSHYDEGRITRLLDPHPVWEDLADQSIARYAEIEAESGISFYNEVGVLLGAPEGSEYLARVRDVRAKAGIAAAEYSGDALRGAFPYLAFDDDMVMLFQDEKAGHISPRRLVAAQTEAARRHGARVVDAVVDRVEDGKVWVEGAEQSFDRVLVACGAFSNMVLEPELALRRLARTITFFELDEAEVARLADMPSVIYRVDDGSDPYVLPPIRYPNGKTFLKIGGEPDSQALSDTHELCAWFQTGGSDASGAYMRERIDGLLPGLRYASVHTESCVVSYTETGLPYIGAVSDKVVVAVGGCGAAAKSCDEIGRIAAGLACGGEDQRFKVVYNERATS